MARWQAQALRTAGTPGLCPTLYWAAPRSERESGPEARRGSLGCQGRPRSGVATWPGCRWCAGETEVEPPSGLSAESRIGLQMAPRACASGAQLGGPWLSRVRPPLPNRSELRLPSVAEEHDFSFDGQPAAGSTGPCGRGTRHSKSCSTGALSASRLITGWRCRATSSVEAQSPRPWSSPWLTARCSLRNPDNSVFMANTSCGTHPKCSVHQPSNRPRHERRVRVSSHAPSPRPTESGGSRTRLVKSR